MPVPPNDHLQLAGSSRWSFAKGRILQISLFMIHKAFFSWPRAPRAYLLRKLNRWVCPYQQVFYITIYNTSRSYMSRPHVILILPIIFIPCRDPLSRVSASFAFIRHICLYISDPDFSCRRDGTDEPTEGSTRGPRGPKNKCVCIWSIFRC